MNIVVVLRAVQDPAGLVVNRRVEKVFINRESYRLNPADHNGLEAALSAAGSVHNVTAVSYGGAPAEQVLRDAVATGATRALWVQDPALHQADAGVVTQVLRAAIEYVGGAELVVLGAEVLDADLAQVAPRLAVALSGTFVGNAHQLNLSDAGTVQAVTPGSGGYRRVEAEAPVVAAVARDSNRPRFAPAARIITAYSTPDAVEVVTPADLGLGETELKALTEARGLSFPPERELGTILEGTPEDTARHVAKLLGGRRNRLSA